MDIIPYPNEQNRISKAIATFDNFEQEYVFSRDTFPFWSIEGRRFFKHAVRDRQNESFPTEVIISSKSIGRVATKLAEPKISYFYLNNPLLADIYLEVNQAVSDFLEQLRIREDVEQT